MHHPAPFLLFGALLLFAFDAQARELSFGQALDLARRNAVQLRILAAEQELAEGAYQRSAQAFLPRVHADASWLRADSGLLQDVPIPEMGLPPRIVRRDFGPVEGVVGSVGLVQPVLNVDAWKAREQARLVLDARRLASRWGREAMHVSVAARYFAVTVHEQTVHAARLALSAARHAFRLARSAFREGLVPKVDEYRAQAEMEGAKARLEGEHARLLAARIDLAKLLGLSGRDIVILTSALPEPRPPDPNLGAAGTRPDYKAAQARLEAAVLGLEKEKARRLPRLNMLARRQWFDGIEPRNLDGEGWLLAVRLQWTLFDGMDREGAVAEARARENLSRAELERLRRDIAGEQKQTLGDWRAAWSAWQASTNALQAAVVAADLARRQYEEGIGSMNDLLATEAKLHHCRVEQARLRYRAFLASMNFSLAHGQDPLHAVP